MARSARSSESPPAPSARGAIRRSSGCVPCSSARPAMTDRDDVENLPALAATIEPLPGGLADLRRRLRAPIRVRRQLGLALAAACCAAIAVWLLRPPPP